MKSTDFLALAALKKGSVEINGQAIHVRELSVGERAEFMSIADKSPALAPAFLVRVCALNEDGSQMFSEADADALANSSPGVVDTVAAKVMSLSKLGDDEDPNG